MKYGIASVVSLFILCSFTSSGYGQWIAIGPEGGSVNELTQSYFDEDVQFCFSTGYPSYVSRSDNCG